jgi:NADPH:quinone reductase
MKAVRVHAFGGPEQLVLDELDEPRVQPSEVLVEIHAAGVNPVDTYIRSGTHIVKPPLPYIPGFDGAGVVLEVGADVHRISVGDRVYVVGSMNGTYAERAVCAPEHVHRLPDGFTFPQGAAIGIPYTTAYRAVVQIGRVCSGEWVLVHGASGAVGLAALQIARAAGGLVIGTASTARGRQLIAAQGTDPVLDHEGQAFEDGVRQLTKGRGVDLIVEMLANQNLGRDLSLLGKNGRVVVVGSRGPVEINPRDLMTREAAVHGVFFFGISPDDLRTIQQHLAEAFSDGSARPVVGNEFPLAEAARAHEHVLNSGARGKVVLSQEGAEHGQN